jgi:hypothetical protein
MLGALAWLQFIEGGIRFTYYRYQYFRSNHEDREKWFGAAYGSCGNRQWHHIATHAIRHGDESLRDVATDRLVSDLAGTPGSPSDYFSFDTDGDKAPDVIIHIEREKHGLIGYRMEVKKEASGPVSVYRGFIGN